MTSVIIRTESQEDREISISGTWLERARKIRKDPTVVLARAILAAPLINNEWQVVGDDKKQRKILEKVLLPMKECFWSTAIFSGIDYGWHSWEVRPQKHKKTTYLKVKSLRHDCTELYLKRNGELKLVKNSGYESLDEAELKQSNFAHIASYQEYDSVGGYPLLKNTDEVMQDYEEAHEGHHRFMTKVAGTHWALWYPVGSTEDKDGNLIDNLEIADKVLDSLESSGKVALPVSRSEINELLQDQGVFDARKTGWRLELLESNAGNGPFLDSKRYYDALKMRSLLVPERMALEGQFGTKSDSSEHADVALMAIEQWGSNFYKWINSEFGFVGRALEYNGQEIYPGGARIKPLPIADDTKSFYREILRTVLNKDETFHKGLDIKALMDKIGVPYARDARS